MSSRLSARAALVGLVALLWFAALAKGANDLWAVCVINGGLTLCTALILSACYSRQIRLYLPLLFNVLVILATFLVSARFSYDVNTSRLELWIWTFSAIAFFLFINIFRDPSIRLQFLTAAGLVILPITVIAFRQYLSSPAFAESAILTNGLHYSHWSARSTFTNSAVLAGFSLSWIMIFWHFRHHGLIYRSLFVLSLAALIFARSWWSFLSLALGFGFYYREHLSSIYHGRPKRAIGISAAVFIFCALIIVLKFGLIQDPLHPSTDRWSWWIAGARMFYQHPLCGVGLGAYGSAFPFFRPQMVLNTVYAHCFPVQVLAETGLLGMGSVLIFATFYGRLVKREGASTQEYSAYMATLVILLSYSVTSIYLDYYIGKLMLLMALALTLSSADCAGYLLSPTTWRRAMAGLLLLVPSWFLPFTASQAQVRGLHYELNGELDRAQSSFQNALLINPYQDESALALGRLYDRNYLQSHSVLTLSLASLWTERALSLKRDLVPVSQ